jgi:hypothetical protein
VRPRGCTHLDADKRLGFVTNCLLRLSRTFGELLDKTTAGLYAYMGSYIFIAEDFFYHNCLLAWIIIIDYSHGSLFGHLDFGLLLYDLV